MNELTMQEINPAERSRAYSFPGGEKIVLAEVTAICVRQSGTHRLKTADGKLHIVPAGWLHIEIDADNWSL